MGKIVILSDNVARSKSAIHGGKTDNLFAICDLFVDVMPDDRPEMIVIDVEEANNHTIQRLIATLGRIRKPDIPLLLLSINEAAISDNLRQCLGAYEAFAGPLSPNLVRTKITRMWENIGSTNDQRTVKLASDAREYFVETFLSESSVTPELATTGSDLIAKAIKECGIANWVIAVQQFDNATHQHCLLVAGLAAAFGTALGLGAEQSYRLTKSSLLHDVGKTRIPHAILNKPGPLTNEEMAIMRTHAVEGYDMLIEGGFSQETMAVVRSHHELLDGSGYPDGLKGIEIPDLVRLVTICDIFAALIERRSYKSPMPAHKAFNILGQMHNRLDRDLLRSFKPLALSFK